MKKPSLQWNPRKKKNNKRLFQPDFLVAGLGNPGARYKKTRHNVGFLVLDALREEGSPGGWSRVYGAWVRKYSMGGKSILLAKPRMFMNFSGPPLKKIMERYMLSPEQLLVVHDDLDMPPGRLRFKRGGGAGGHRGAASIIAALCTGDFVRLKVGIGRPPEGAESGDYVLAEMTAEERRCWNEYIKLAAEAVVYFLEYGLGAAMNKYNNIKVR
ncbi:MAG: aminoacyl-tRNA hydrolase [Bacillota bacterium]